MKDTSCLFHGTLDVPILLPVICPHTIRPSISPHSLLKTLMHCLCSIVIAGSHERNHSRKAIDAAVDDNFPGYEFVMSINMPERIDPWNTIDSTLDWGGSKGEAASVDIAEQPTDGVPWDLDS